MSRGFEAETGLGEAFAIGALEQLLELIVLDVLVDCCGFGAENQVQLFPTLSIFLAREPSLICRFGLSALFGLYV
ncbi:hypothetical protein [Stenotrophomonas sp. B1-1]|uniref:hypothetical protein n=1 Tax=Stenotrophomonas sp. B1-1 TaxID=2710648 RepID=UPI0013DCDA2B|nr:hypothetical protein [Stenotrophomonas sp. B1-1]